MAGRGRPRKDTLNDAAAEAKKNGQSYGHYMENLQKKDVVVNQCDGIKREKAGAKNQRMSMRTYRHQLEAIQEIEGEIAEHDRAIDVEKKAADEHLENIRLHQQAIKELKEELKEEQNFLKAHEP